MNVVCENIDELNAVLKVNIEAADYKEKYDKTLADYRKNAKIPGFRPGKVPMGMIVKQYGKAVLADELNKLVNDNLHQYITTNNLQILGSPIPKYDTEVKGDWDKPENFEFAYEIGYAPKFDLPLTGKEKFDYLKIKIDEKLVEEEVENIRKRYGKLISTDEITSDEIVSIDVIELNADGSEKENGIKKSTSFSMALVSDKTTIKTFKAAKVGDMLDVDLTKITKNQADMALMLGVEAPQIADINPVFKVEIMEIRTMEMAELNQELFDKVFGPDAVKSEAELKNKIRQDLEGVFAKNERVVFMNTIYDHLMEKVNPEFPSDFLKRWLKMTSEKELAEEQWDNEMDAYLRSLKYRLIQNKVFSENNVEIKYDDIIAHTKELLKDNYRQYGINTDDIPEQEMMQTVMKVLQDEKQMSEVQSQVTEKKFEELISGMVKKKEKEVSFEEFQKLTQNN
jgi:trigger factor